MSFNKYSNLSLLNMPDCVALSDLKKCSRLTTLECDKSMCPFKQSTDEKMLQFKVHMIEYQIWTITHKPVYQKSILKAICRGKVKFFAAFCFLYSL